MAPLTSKEIRRLTVAERVHLVEEIWDSIAAAPDSLPVPEAQIRELERRLKLHEEDPDGTSSWSAVRSRLTHPD